VALLRAVQRRAAAEALALIRELDKPVIPRRASLTTGGPWGETASALNVAADHLEQRARLERAVRVYVGDELAEDAEVVVGLAAGADKRDSGLPRIRLF